MHHPSIGPRLMTIIHRLNICIYHYMQRSFTLQTYFFLPSLSPTINFQCSVHSTNYHKNTQPPNTTLQQVKNTNYHPKTQTRTNYNKNTNLNKLVPWKLVCVSSRVWMLRSMAMATATETRITKTRRTTTRTTTTSCFTFLSLFLGCCCLGLRFHTKQNFIVWACASQYLCVTATATATWFRFGFARNPTDESLNLFSIVL